MVKKILIFINIIVIALISSCSKEIGEKNIKNELINIKVSLDWTPNTNHTGLYVAKKEGYYKDMGLSVEIIQPSSGTSEKLVSTNKVQFGISYQEAVTFSRLEGLPVVSIAAIIQHNTSGFASIKSKNIKTPKDFEGKSYGGWGSPIELATIKALMEKYNADYNTVKILTNGSADFFVSTGTDIDFAWIFEGWTGIEAKLKGIEINYIKLSEENPALDYYTPVIITNEQMIMDKPDIVMKFMKAASKGYEEAIKNPDYCANILLEYAPELNKDLVLESQKFLSSKYQDDSKVWGYQKIEVWEKYTNWLYDKELISKKININKAFTNNYLLK